MIAVERAEDRSALAGWSEAWRELADADPRATPFQSPDWASAWLDGPGRGRRIASLLVREGRDPVALFPLVRHRVPVATLRWIGTGASDYLMPLVRPGYEAAAADAFREAADRAAVADLHQLPDDHPFAGAIEDERVERVPQAACLRLTLPPTFAEYEAGLSKSLRYEVRRRGKGPYRDGSATLEVAEDPAAALAAWRTFLELHSRRWRRRGLPGAFALPSVRRLHEAWIPRAQASDRLRMITLRHEGRPVGVLYGMRTPRTWFFYQSGFDPEAAALSPGTVLVAEAIERAIGEGATTFDFLRGDEPYKRRWRPDKEGVNLRMMVPMGGAMSGTGTTWNRTGHRIDAALRRRFEGRGLRS